MAGLRTRRLLLTLWAALGLWATTADAQPRSVPRPPEVTLAEGAELVSLVRTAMLRYIRRRTPADRQAVPARLKRLAKRPYAAAVTLRDSGRPVATDIRAADSVPRSVIAAALWAMRSPKLPDRVTQPYLDSLTVEVEVLGGPRPVAEDDLAAAVLPGRTGLMLSRGHRSAYSLVSAGIVLGLRPGEMRNDCLAQLGLDRQAGTVPLQWATFASRHYVGYPNGQVKWLQRGKLLVPREVIDESLLADAARKVARYLASTQREDGRYLPGADLPSRAQHAPSDEPMVDHLYATWVMARLLRGAGEGDRRLLAASVNQALAYAARRVRPAEGDAWKYVGTEDPANQLAATALLVLTLDQAPPSEPGAALQKALVAGLVGAIGRDDRLPGRLSGSSGAARPVGEASLRHAALACLALSTAMEKTSPDAAKVAKLRKALASRATSRARATDVETTLWWARAGLEFPPDRSATRRASARFPLPVPAGGEAPAIRDEIGGFGPLGGEPTTVVTAWTAVQIRAQLASPRSRPAGRTAGLREQCLEARRFCYQMMYKPYEAYFAAKPDARVGAVRAGPASAAVSLRACGAAVEAFLAK